LTSPRWHHPDLVLCRREQVGWVETSSTSGGTIWQQTEDDRQVGVLASWGVTQSGEPAFRVTFHGRATDVPVTNGYYVWMAEGVARTEVNDPAVFQPLR
jgi:hypothetical protein